MEESYRRARMTDPRRLEGKVALVAGGSSGLGEATARRFVAEGAKVVLTGRDEHKGERVAAAMGQSAHFVPQDVRDEAGWAAVVAATAERFGGLHVLVNSAGLIRSSPVETLELEDFRLHHQVMVEGTFLGCKHAIPVIHRSGGGAIVNVSSVGAIKSGGNYLAYATAKAAVLALTRSVSNYCQEQRYAIRVNSIVPGGFATPMSEVETAKLFPDDPVHDRMREMGMGDPADFANLALFLASDESRHMTGSMMVIDDGYLAR
jgi:3(or 17)beta-hydroxysteroid dehydrogenase